MKKILQINLVVFLLLMGCSQTPVTPDPKKISVTIQVLDQNNQPLAEVPVGVTQIIKDSETDPSKKIGAIPLAISANAKGQVILELDQGNEYEITTPTEKKRLIIPNAPITIYMKSNH